MSFVVSTSIKCDGEGCRRETLGTYGDDVRKMDETVRVQRLGWKITPERHLCPDCAAKEPQP